MALASGTRIGIYEVLGPLGAGGMGEVYRARDTKLLRDVALKVLPDLFARDADRLARFEREAHVLASLNHPNIAAIYGVEDAANVHALAMELVPGRTLEDLLHDTTSDGSPGASRALPVADALAIARQVADALDAAHVQGVVHRDLKPANVKITDDGRVKVLDFGLAKTVQTASGSGRTPSTQELVTMTSPAMTEMGVILGTAAYMSPEQARGRPTDQRVDTWAFGAMLFEMLAGRRPFAGQDTSELIASLLRDEPDWNALPLDTPTSVRRLLRRCLEKDPARRLRSMADARLDLDEPEPALAPAATATNHAARRQAWPFVVMALAAGAALATAVLAWLTPAFRTTTAPLPRRFSIDLPSDLTLALDPSQVAVSPDGRFVAFAATERGATDGAIWVRAIGSLNPRKLAGTERGLLPFWSPDGRELAFFADHALKKTLADGSGLVQEICPADDGRGGTWSSSGVIVFAPGNVGALERVSASGGDPQPATTVDTTRGETGERFPSFLPDGRHFLFVELPGQMGQYQISMGSIDSTVRTRLRMASGAAIYAQPGFLVFAWRNQIAAQPFDAARLTLSGDPVAISASQSLGNYSADPAASTSATGVLIYPQVDFTPTQLAWLDVTGKDLGTVPAPAGRASVIRISPDDRQAAIINDVTPSDSTLWTIDLEHGGATRLTNAPTQPNDPVWSPDGTRILFADARTGTADFYVVPSNGSAPPTLVYASKRLFADPRAWSPDGKFMAFEVLDPRTNRDLWLLPMDGPPTPRPYRQTPANETEPTISPDGHWVAYISDETGRPEIYVDAFPTPGARVAVTTGGGNGLAWRHDGREVLVSDTENVIYVADVLPGPEFHLSPLRRLPIVFPASALSADVRGDLQRALIARTTEDPRPRSLTVLLDWASDLRR